MPPPPPPVEVDTSTVTSTAVEPTALASASDDSARRQLPQRKKARPLRLGIGDDWAMVSASAWSTATHQPRPLPVGGARAEPSASASAETIAIVPPPDKKAKGPLVLQHSSGYELPLAPNTASGFRGVSRIRGEKRRGRPYQVLVQLDKERTERSSLGTYATAVEAAVSYAKFREAERVVGAREAYRQQVGARRAEEARQAQDAVAQSSLVREVDGLKLFLSPKSLTGYKHVTYIDSNKYRKLRYHACAPSDARGRRPSLGYHATAVEAAVTYAKYVATLAPPPLPAPHDADAEGVGLGASEEEQQLLKAVEVEEEDSGRAQLVHDPHVSVHRNDPRPVEMYDQTDALAVFRQQQLKARQAAAAAHATEYGLVTEVTEAGGRVLQLHLAPGTQSGYKGVRAVSRSQPLWTLAPCDS